MLFLYNCLKSVPWQNAKTLQLKLRFATMDDIIYKWFVKIISGLNSLTIFVILFVKTLIYSSNFSFTKLENKNDS